jgi:hypothetical protein
MSRHVGYAPNAKLKQGIGICLDGHSGLMASPARVIQASI